MEWRGFVVVVVVVPPEDWRGHGCGMDTCVRVGDGGVCGKEGSQGGGEVGE